MVLQSSCKHDHKRSTRRLCDNLKKVVKSNIEKLGFADCRGRTEYHSDMIENIINIYEDMLIKALCEENTYVS